jgi:hypothetical protein
MPTLRDRLLLLVFELRLGGCSACQVAVLYDAADSSSPNPALGSGKRN